jgi:hypothetical protein
VHEVNFMGKIIEVIAGDDYLLTVRLENNNIIILNMKKKLHTIRFSEIRDRKVFGLAATDGKAIYWPGGLSLTLNEIMEIAVK